MLSDSESASTDTRSDISFINRQTELRKLYREFRCAIDTINAPILPELGNDYDEYDEETQGFESDVALLVEEVNLMLSEIAEITSLLSRPRFARNNRVRYIKKQLDNLYRINANLKSRAEAVLDID